MGCDEEEAGSYEKEEEDSRGEGLVGEVRGWRDRFNDQVVKHAEVIHAVL